MSHPTAAAGASLVRVIGAFVMLGGLFSIPDAFGWVTLILGVVVVWAATRKMNEHSA